jgi:ABC-type phosphate/phosphonate transport system substrate-binding protein
MHRQSVVLRQTLAAGALLVGCFFHDMTSAAEYTVRIEPTNPPDRIVEIYAPMMAYLKQATGADFKIEASKNYHNYWRDVLSGVKTDFAFDEAHLASYRIQHAKFEPLVHAAEPTSYTLVSNIDIDKKGVNGLVGHKIVSMSAPSLGYAILLEFYPNPVLQPDIVSTATSWQDATDRVFGGEADAAMIPTGLKDQYPNLIPVKTSREFAGRCLSASPDVPADIKEKVKDALLKLDPDSDAAKLLFELGVTKFVPATAAEYANAEQTLKNFIGYK